MKITSELFDLIPFDAVFATGFVPNSPRPDGIFMTNSDEGRLLRYAAVKGYGNDWALYVLWAKRPGDRDTPISYIAASGDKVMDMENVKHLIDCEDAVYLKYRR